MPQRRILTVWTTALLAAFAVAGCQSDKTAHADKDGRPRAKPAEVTALVAGADADVARLSRARVSTRSGEILILEPDGSVTSMSLDSPEGRDAFMVTQADLEALNANLDLDLGGIAPLGVATVPRQSAQQRAIEAFAARTQPALPVVRPGTVVSDEDFIAARVDSLNADLGNDLVEVTANLRRGVDAEIGFAYATCALAGWADRNGVAYGRHIRTLSATRDGKLLIGSAFTLSKERPLGLRVMETKETLRECEARGIPAA